MNTRIALLLCAPAIVAACGGSDARRPRTASATQITSARADEAPAPTPTPTFPSTDQSTNPIYRSSDSAESLPRRPAAPAALAHTPDTASAAPDASDPATLPIKPGDPRSRALPLEQGHSGREHRITADIRRRVVGDSALSFTAKSVTIATVGTIVTLRGPVRSAEEKALVIAHAKEIKDVTDVEDQLDIVK